MIYVISPFLADAKQACEQKNVICPTKAGRLLNPNIFWIYDWQQLAGRKIFGIDKIIYGDQVNRFEPGILERIKLEIENRRL